MWRGAVVVAAGAVLGVIFFISYSDVRIVDPREWRWVMNGKDMRLQYTGWQFFRLEPWAIPPGRITRMLYPVGSSVGNTGSLPLVAIALKPFNGLLPQDFQYFGIWYFLSAVLHGVFAALLLSLIGGGSVFLLLGTALFLWNPVALPIGDTPGLAATGWTILAGLYLYFRPLTTTTRLRELCAWLVLVAVASGAHPYVCVMVLAIAAAFFARRWRPDRALGAVAAGLSLSSIVLAVVVLWWVEGHFALSSYSDTTGGALGRGSMNLLSPINPMGWSRFLPNWPITGNQYEGFVYCGLGILLLAAAGAVSSIARLPSRSELAALAPLLLACGLLGVVAASPKITLGASVLFTLPQELYGPFRSFRASGRFVQPAFYLMVFLLLRRVARQLPWWRASAVVLAVLVIEFADIRHKLDEIRWRNRNPSKYDWQQPVHWESWRFASASYRQLVIVPSAAWDEDTVVAFTFFAARFGLAINTGAPARVDRAALRSYRQALRRELTEGPLDAATVYVVHPLDIDGFTNAHRSRVSCRELDGVHACVAAP